MKKAPVMHDERPDRGWCKKVPLAVCAVAYDRCFTALSYYRDIFGEYEETLLK